MHALRTPDDALPAIFQFQEKFQFGDSPENEIALRFLNDHLSLKVNSPKGTRKEVYFGMLAAAGLLCDNIRVSPRFNNEVEVEVGMSDPSDLYQFQVIVNGLVLECSLTFDQEKYEIEVTSQTDYLDARIGDYLAAGMCAYVASFMEVALSNLTE